MVVGGGNDNPLPQIADKIAADAAANGLSAWGFSLLRQLGRPIKPEWLKESSREWFNKELPQPWIPPKDEFLKYVEPFAQHSNLFSTTPGVNQLRHKYGLPVSSGFKGHEYVLEEDPANRKAPLDPGAPQTPSLRAQAETVAAKLAADQVSYRTANSYKPIDEDNPPAGMTKQQARQRNREMNATAEANFRATHLGADDVLKARAVAPTGVLQVPSTATTNTFLPPYLQPGSNTGAPPIAPAIGVGAPGPAAPLPLSSLLVPMGTPQNINPLFPQSPLNPLMPAGQFPGSPLGAPMPIGLFATGPNRGMGRINTGGGFNKTAKLLELPYYLRNMGGTAYGR